MRKTKMTPQELKYNLENRKSNSYFFSKDTMRAFGDTMSNYGIMPHTVDIIDIMGNIRECYELFRKKPNKLNLISSAYFDVNSFEWVYKPC